jgi:hypothetical protein
MRAGVHLFGRLHHFIHPPNPVRAPEGHMATFVRNRVLNQLSWPQESEETRADRRVALCELDGLLAQLEEANLRGTPVPPRVLVSLRRRGVLFRPRVSAAELIEAIFAVQEQYMRQPDSAPSREPAALQELRRRLAS